MFMRLIKKKYLNFCNFRCCCCCINIPSKSGNVHFEDIVNIFQLLLTNLIHERNILSFLKLLVVKSLLKKLDKTD